MAPFRPDANPEDVLGVQSLDDRVVRFLQRLTRADRVPSSQGIAAAVARRPGILVLVAVAIIAAAGARHAVVYPRIQERAAAEAAAEAEQSVVPLGADVDLDEFVGPVLGSVVTDHVAARQAALAELLDPEEKRSAVVSFTGLRSAGDAAGLLDGARVSVAHAQLLLPERDRPRQTEVVRGDLDASVARLVVGEIERIDAELAAVEQQLADPGLTDEAFRADYRDRVNELQGLRRQLDTAPDIVFAVVVEGTVEALRDVAVRPGVRLVDLAPEGVGPGDAAFFGLLPRDTNTVTFGAPA